MARVNKGVVLGMAHAHWGSYLASTEKARHLDAWLSGSQYDLEVAASNPLFGQPYSPRETTSEYDDLSRRSANPFAGLVVASLAQTAYVDGIRLAGSNDNLKTWRTFQQNRWNSRQGAVHRAAIGHGQSFGIVMPGKDPLTGDKMARMLTRSAKRMAVFYDEDDDEYPRFGMDAVRYERVDPFERGYTVTVWDENAQHFLIAKNDGLDIKDWEYVSYDEHPMKVAPVARCANRLDLDGKATGEIEPVIPMLQRVDQDTFDRLIVQRFGAWKVRWIAGMAKPSTAQLANIQALKLKVEDLLISSNKDTKFGTLDSTPLDGFIAATDHDLRMLAAVTQTPPHHLLGLSSNLQAEALAAAESGLQRKSADFRMNAGEFHEQMSRMAAVVNGESAEARAFDIQVRWRDTESRSMAQAAQALGQLATTLKVPVEMLWERIPGWTDADSARAKELIEVGGVEQLLAEVLADQEQERAAQQQTETEVDGGDGND